MPDHTYDSLMNTPAHRPGAEGVVNRRGDASKAAAQLLQRQDPRDQSGNRMAGNRPQPGEADAQTRHKALQIMGRAEPSPDADAAPKPSEAASGAGKPDTTTLPSPFQAGARTDAILHADE